MNRLTLKLLALVVLIWTTWWVLATNGMQRGLNAWFDARQFEGWQASAGEMSRGGFPLRIATNLRDVSLDDPATQSALRIPQVALSTPIYWPGHATVRMPAQPVTITTPQRVLTLTTSGTEANLRLHPGTSLQLDAMHASMNHVWLEIPEGRIFSASSVQADIQQGDTPTTYHFGLAAEHFVLGSVFREFLAALDAKWSDTFEPIIIDMTVTFDRPWDRSALAGSRPQPRAIEIVTAEAIWADLRISAATNLTVSEGGVLSGSVKVQAQNWQRMLDIASASGALSADMHPQIESGITLLSGSSDTLDLDITIEDGRMRMGFIPLGNAPLLILR